MFHYPVFITHSRGPKINHKTVSAAFSSHYSNFVFLKKSNNYAEETDAFDFVLVFIFIYLQHKYLQSPEMALNSCCANILFATS